jgi:REP element-mobilizing transposase RayT
MSVCATKIPPGRRFQILDTVLDKASTGPLWLRDPLVATQIIQTLRKGESALHQYSLHSFVVMPNHVHILISPKIPLSRITNGIKGVTSRRAKSILALQQKHFWQDESFDHWVRSPEQFDTIRRLHREQSRQGGLGRSSRGLALVQLHRHLQLKWHSHSWLCSHPLHIAQPQTRTSTSVPGPEILVLISCRSLQVAHPLLAVQPPTSHSPAANSHIDKRAGPRNSCAYLLSFASSSTPTPGCAATHFT